MFSVEILTILRSRVMFALKKKNSLSFLVCLKYNVILNFFCIKCIKIFKLTIVIESRISRVIRKIAVNNENPTILL